MHDTERLLVCLRGQAEVGRRIVEELGRQHRALQKLDLAGLEVSTAALEAQASAMREADARREEAARAVAAAQGLPADAPLREVLPAVPAGAGLRPALEKVWTELSRLLGEMHHRNYANYVLMLNAARYNRAILQFVSGTCTTYRSSGAAGEAGESQSVVLNKKA